MTATSPFFTIIIPVFNVEQYLQDCLNSIVTQTYSDYEVICINDGSTDGSLTILEEYRQKYPQIIIISQPNKGLSSARNTGIQVAKGNYIFFLDSDDWIETNSLKILAEKQKGEDIICFNGRRYFEDGREEIPDMGLSQANLKGWDYYNKYALNSRNFHFVCSVLRLYKREFLLKNNLFFELGIFHEDNLFTPIVCYFAEKIKVIPDQIYCYRIRNGSITNTYNSKRIFDMIYIANKLSDFFIPLSNIEKSIIYKEISGEFYSGFMKERINKFGNFDKELFEIINWSNFKIVSVYWRHKIIYYLIRIHPKIFRNFIGIENFIKNILK